MTEKDLSKLFYISKEIDRLKDDIDALGCDTLVIPILSDLPKGNSNADSVANLAIEIATLKEMLNKKVVELFKTRVQIEQFLDTIEDSEMKLICRLRHINMLTWSEIARQLGYEDSSVRKKYHRYFARLEFIKNCQR